jgi:hypothetical protein
MIPRTKSRGTKNRMRNNYMNDEKVGMDGERS